MDGGLLKGDNFASRKFLEGKRTSLKRGFKKRKRTRREQSVWKTNTGGGSKWVGGGTEGTEK